MKAVREEDGRAESYTIMKSDLKDLNSNRDY
jgi:hypothetical protein